MSLHLISGQICLAAAVVVIVYDLNVAARQYPGTGYDVHIVIISMFHPVSRRMRYTANGSGSGRKKPKPTATATASWLSQLAVSRSFSVVETTTQANCRYDPDGRILSIPQISVTFLYCPDSFIDCMISLILCPICESQHANHTLTGLVESEVFYLLLLLSLLSL